MKKSTKLAGIIGLGVIAFVILVLVITVAWAIGTYNAMIRMNENVKQSWGQVENVYQRRADLIPNLVETVKGYASHEKTTLTGVIEARANATKVTIDPSKMDITSLQKFQQAQGELSSALARLMVVVEQYPNLKANENFKELQAELAGTENRIAVERRKFNQAAQEYNTKIRVFPSSLIAGFKGFQERPYFEADKGAKEAPKVKFN